MQKTDLMPMYITLFQHEISRELMQRVLDAYKRFGADHFTESLECIELGGAELSMKADADKLTLAKTLEITKMFTRSINRRSKRLVCAIWPRNQLSPPLSNP